LFAAIILAFGIVKLLLGGRPHCARTFSAGHWLSRLFCSIAASLLHDQLARLGQEEAAGGRYLPHNSSCVSFLKRFAQVVDMPLRWHGAAGHFTKEFEMNVPGAKAVEVNQYRCRSLNVIQTKSKVRDVQSAFLIDAGSV
jgi:hypothetical protein